MSSRIREQSRIHITEPIFHAPEDTVFLFRSPAKLPIRCVQREVKKRIDRAAARNLTCGRTTNSIRHHQSITGFLERLSGLGFRQISENCLQGSSNTNNQEM